MPSIRATFSRQVAQYFMLLSNCSEKVGLRLAKQHCMMPMTDCMQPKGLSQSSTDGYPMALPCQISMVCACLRTSLCWTNSAECLQPRQPLRQVISLQALQWCHLLVTVGESFSNSTDPGGLKDQLATIGYSFYRNTHTALLQGLFTALEREKWLPVQSSSVGKSKRGE